MRCQTNPEDNDCITRQNVLLARLYDITTDLWFAWLASNAQRIAWIDCRRCCRTDCRVRASLTCIVVSYGVSNLKRIVGVCLLVATQVVLPIAGADAALAGGRVDVAGRAVWLTPVYLFSMQMAGIGALTYSFTEGRRTHAA